MALVTALIIFLFFYFLIGFLAASAMAVGISVVAGILTYLTVYSPIGSWRMELYEDQFKVYHRGDLIQDAVYSDIVRIGRKRYSLFYQRYVLYGKENRAFVVLPSDPRRSELGDLRLTDWLKRRIAPSM
jgi:hypothetical protein